MLSEGSFENNHKTIGLPSEQRVWIKVRLIRTKLTPTVFPFIVTEAITEENKLQVENYSVPPISPAKPQTVLCAGKCYQV